jgi:hypothetical protein
MLTKMAMTMIMGQEHKRETVWNESVGGGKKRILRGEGIRSIPLITYEDSVVKASQHCVKRGGWERVEIM